MIGPSRIGVVAILVVGVACGGGAGGRETGGPCRSEGAIAHLTVKNTRFSASCLAVSSGAGIAVEFENQDAGVAHNLGIYDLDPRERPDATELFRGDLVTGPTMKEYRVGALSAGTYHFQCDVHPGQMFGTLLVGP